MFFVVTCAQRKYHATGYGNITPDCAHNLQFLACLLRPESDYLSQYSISDTPHPDGEDVAASRRQTLTVISL